MAIPNDWKEFIELLNEAGVEYVIVGAHVLGFHGIPRLTNDIDFLVRPTKDNSERIVRVLRDFGFEPMNLKPEDFQETGTFVQLGYAPNRIDVITSIAGVSFDEAWRGRVEGEFAGVHARFLGAEEFIASKKAAGRKKDLGDAEELELLLRGRKRPTSKRTESQ